MYLGNLVAIRIQITLVYELENIQTSLFTGGLLFLFVKLPDGTGNYSAVCTLMEKNEQWLARVIALRALKAYILAVLCFSNVSQRSTVTVSSFSQS